jgi:hypothetical protein
MCLNWQGTIYYFISTNNALCVKAYVIQKCFLMLYLILSLDFQVLLSEKQNWDLE